MRSPASPTRAGRSRCRSGGRRCRSRCGACCRALRSTAARMARSIDHDWGEPELTPAERVFGWNSFEVLAFTTGTPERRSMPFPARRARIASSATWSAPTPTTSSRRCAATSTATAFSKVEVRRGNGGFFPASRLDPADPWVTLAAASIERTTGTRADDPAQPRGLAAQRHLHRRAQAEDDLGSALLCWLLAARARRASARADRARRARPDGRTCSGTSASRAPLRRADEFKMTE